MSKVWEVIAELRCWHDSTPCHASVAGSKFDKDAFAKAVAKELDFGIIEALEEMTAHRDAWREATQYGIDHDYAAIWSCYDMPADRLEWEDEAE